jgi:hypothetical protein
MYVNVNGMLFLLLLLYMVPATFTDGYVAVVVIFLVGVVVLLLLMMLWLHYMAHDATQGTPCQGSRAGSSAEQNTLLASGQRSV